MDEEKKWLVGVGMLFLLTVSACGSKEQKVSYTLKQDDENVTVQNMYKEDQLLKQTVTTIIQYKTMGVETKAKAEKLLEPSKNLYCNKSGISYSIDFQKSQAVETIELELGKLSEEEVKRLPLLSLPEGDFDSASEKVNEEKLIQLGFKKKN